MKSTTLSPQARQTINAMVCMMMDMNNHANQEHALQRNAYGSLSKAVKQFIAVETGIAFQVLQEEDFNWGGNRCYADDAQTVIDELLK